MSDRRDKTPSESASAPSAGRRLPTRVNNACRRCRRNKSRCDSFRPCSLCLRADVDCQPASFDEAPSISTRGRNQRQGPNLRKPRRAQFSSGDHNLTSAPRMQQSPAPSQRNVNDGDEGQAAGPADLVSKDSHRPYMAVDYGKSESAMGFARKMSRLGTKTIDSHPTSAIPDGECEARALLKKTGDARLPISTILGCRFPDQQLICSLLEDYFDAVHWFSLVIYEPNFRERLSYIKDGYAYHAESPFLVLLSMVLCMAAWYRSKRVTPEAAEEWRLWSDDLLQIVESRLVSVMDQLSIEAVQTCILLGSHHVYHGRPNLSFALLGATIKISHAMGLHRNSRPKSSSDTSSDAEERKRVWWTVYTWDRFASISYGRPLSIKDEDCNAGMPAEFSESPYFVENAVDKELPAIVYSPYQTELSKLYLIASPALTAIFGSISTPTSKEKFESSYALLVSDVTQRLIAWHQQLPPNLTLDLDLDFDPRNSSCGTRVHSLQSLSLQLTFDNLLIVLYRPFLACQVEHLSMEAYNSQGASVGSDSQISQPQMPFLNPELNSVSTPDHASPMSDTTMCSEYWLRAAMRTARITELPQLARLATDSHLVGFMALNLFHAAIVLILLSLSDPLSDRAQGIKRTITRVFHLQKLLGRRSALSTQSSAVLKNLIYLLLQREGDAMFDPLKSAAASVDFHAYQQPQSSHVAGEDALRPPLEAVRAASDQQVDRQTGPNLAMAQRLNESLASIQRTISTSQEQPLLSVDTVPLPTHGLDVRHGQMPMDPPEMWHMLPVQSESSHEPQSINQDEQLADYGGTNLFWLWDSNWDIGSVR